MDHFALVIALRRDRLVGIMSCDCSQTTVVKLVDAAVTATSHARSRCSRVAGAGVVESREQLAAILDDPATPAPLDGTWLVQEYVRADEPCITRCEFIGGRFYYAVRVDTSDGFEVCPADACALPSGWDKFEILIGFDDRVIPRYRACLAASGIEVAGIEFVRRPDWTTVTYDVNTNTNTNYNSRAESVAGVAGMGHLADALGAELARIRKAA